MGCKISLTCALRRRAHTGSNSSNRRARRAASCLTCGNQLARQLRTVQQFNPTSSRALPLQLYQPEAIQHVCISCILHVRLLTSRGSGTSVWLTTGANKLSIMKKLPFIYSLLILSSGVEPTVKRSEACLSTSLRAVPPRAALLIRSSRVPCRCALATPAAAGARGSVLRGAADLAMPQLLAPTLLQRGHHASAVVHSSLFHVGYCWQQLLQR